LKRVISLALVLATATSCGSFVPVADLDDYPPEVRAKIAAIRIVGQGQAPNMKYSVLAMVEGHSCKNLLTDPPATRAAAIDQLKFGAYQAGANAIANVQCGAREPTSYHTNCWDLISCTAEAVTLE
jgi:hypothetical protein